MPDTAFPADELEQNYGYTDGDLLPLSRDRAVELIDKDMTVYILQNGENPSMAFDRDEIAEQSPKVMFAVPREEWEASQDFHQAIADRMNHQEERERAFLDHGGDCFAIYQLRDGEETRNLRYMPLPGQGVDKAFYELAYTGELAPGQDQGVLDKLWEKFNTDHPVDYHRPSMSMSDCAAVSDEGALRMRRTPCGCIVALKLDGVVSCHYVDRLGFTEVHDFIRAENYLKTAEMSVEVGTPQSQRLCGERRSDGVSELSALAGSEGYEIRDDEIDGIINNGPKEEPTVAELEAQVKAGQTISLADGDPARSRDLVGKEGARERTKFSPQAETELSGLCDDAAGAVQRERGEKKSVMARLQEKPPKQEKKRTAPKKSAERDR